MKTLTFAIVIPCCLAAVSRISLAQTIDDLLLLQDSRARGSTKLGEYLRSDKEGVRARAAVAAANIEDSSSLPVLLLLLNDSSALVRRYAAFAVGQLGGIDGAVQLLARLRRETNPDCIREIIDAAGKCGSEGIERSLVMIVSSLPGNYRSPLSLSVARFAYRGVRDSVASEYVGGLCGDTLDAAMAAYALVRIADSALARRRLPALVANAQSASAEVRMWSATALGLVGDSAACEVLSNLSTRDPDWRVRVNAVRALRTWRTQGVGALLLEMILDQNEHIALTAFSVLNATVGQYLSPGLAASLERVLIDSLHYSWQRRGEAAMLLAKTEGDVCIPKIATLLNGNFLFRRRIISAMGETKSASALLYIKPELRRDESVSVCAAIESYAKIVNGRDSGTQTGFCADILPLLTRHDIGVSFTIALALQDTLIRKSIRLRCLPQLLDAFGRFESPSDVEPMVEFLKLFGELGATESIGALEKALADNDKTVARAAAASLKRITGKNHESKISSRQAMKDFYSSDDLPLLKRYRSAILETTKGRIRIEFRPDAAPFTVLNFILLAKRHFYDGLIFHRVVPNFVIQGGDPLGSGFGGPGYAIRTEVHPNALFFAGAVGMASAGEDTEGSQFFITHCPTPHLDGRYTVFGYTKDLEVVGRIQVGDVVTSVELPER